MKMKVGALVICGLLAVAQNFSGAEQIYDAAGESFLSSSKDAVKGDSGDALKNDPESNEENVNKNTSALGSSEAKQPGDKIKDLIEEISFSENSPVGDIGYQDDASSEIEEAADAGENSDKQSERGSTMGGAAPKILKVKHTAQYNNARPKTEQGLGDWVFDYPK